MKDILIPTCRTSVDSQIAEIESVTPDVRIIASCQPRLSAACNRNYCLDRATGDVLVMVDDDISGFYPGWVDELTAPLLADPLVCMVSARLMTSVGTIGPTCSDCYDATPETIEIKPHWPCILPTAAIAFRNLGLRFDEKFKGSGWEDNDWCYQFHKLLPGGKFIQSNLCRLIHANEKKRQGEFWTFNKDYFEWKWRKYKPASRA